MTLDTMSTQCEHPAICIWCLRLTVRPRAQIYSCDLFDTGFRGDTMNAEKGRRYRYMVLEPGGSQSEMQTLREFLGRDPNTDAFCKEHRIQGLGRD